MLKILTILIALVMTSCSLVSHEDHRDASSGVDIQSLNSRKRELNQKVIQSCTDIKRPLNPSSELTSSETELDRHFRLAFDYETAGNFDLAIFHYQNAAQLSQCDCDRLHAEAGITAAQEAQDLWEKEGMAAKPTQYFWGRLQQLTETLPCVEINYE